MNILERLFKKKKYNIGIIRFGDNIVIPGRDYFNDKKDIELLEEYKEQYISVLSQNNIITTLKFNSNELKQSMNMNVDLILRLLMDNEDFYLLASEELIIQSLKLKMYYEEINAKEKETIMRLIALKEINKRKIPKNNRMAFDEEINQLSVILEMYSYRKAAISIELKNYFDVLSTKNIDKQDEELFKQRLDKLLFITEGIVNKEELGRYEDIKIKIAILERECERYAYLNKKEALKLKTSYDLSFERKILLFYEYGKNYYDEEFIKEFYAYKFKYLTSNINNDSNKSPIDKDDYGFKYYEEIVEDMLTNMKDSYYFSSIKDKANINIPSLLENAKSYLKDENNEFNYEEILLDKYKLAFLISLNYDNGIKDFFYKNKMYLTDDEIKYLYETKGIEWCNAIPLASFFELYMNKKKHQLCSFYELNKIRTNLILPEGVKKVDFLNFSSVHLHKIIDDDPRKKDYYEFPSTMESIYNFSSNNKGLNLILNDGLKEISFMITDIYSVSIPSGLKAFKIYTGLVDSHKSRIVEFRYVEFRDYENSNILNNIENFIDFMKCCAIELATGRIRYHRPSARNLKIQEKYATGRYTTSDHAALFDHEYKEYEYVFDPVFSSMKLLSKDNKTKIVIQAKDLEDHFYKKELYLFELVGVPNYSQIYSKIRETIKEQTGYDIATQEQISCKKCKDKQIGLNMIR